jgi:hypothetical protein
VNIDAYGQPEQSKPLGPHSLRRSFATLAIAQLRDNVMSKERGGLVLDLFPDVIVKADKSYVELRGDHHYSWFGHSQDNPDDAVILSVVDGKLAGIVMRDGDLFHIKALASDSYEITQVDQASFPAERDDEEIATSPRKMSRQKDALTKPLARTEVVGDSSSLEANRINQQEIRPVELGTKLYSKKRYIAVEDKYTKFFIPVAVEDKSGDFSSLFSTINIGVLTSAAVNYGGDYPNISAEVQLAVDQANWAYASSDVQIQLNLTATASTQYQGSGDATTDLKRLRVKTDSYMDSIHATRDSWSWKADIVTLVVNGFTGDMCGRGYTLFYGKNIQDWAEWGFNVVDIHCMTKNFTLTHEVGHNLGATHDWYVEPTTGCPAGEVDFGNGCSTPQVDPWGPSSFSHGYIRHDLKRRTVMAYSRECKDLGYPSPRCPKLLRFSDPGAVVWGGPLGVHQGEYHAADNHAVLNQNRTLVENYR